MIETKGLSFSYKRADQLLQSAIVDLNFVQKKGSHVAILGRNGSGKSTLAKLITYLELADQGVVLIDGAQAETLEDLYELRRRLGLVFQNPDNQIVGTTLEEDVAFGPENLSVNPAEIRRRTDEALKRVGLLSLAKRSPSMLSGGQKQKLAIAGILAMEPSCLILDEATAMLDPVTAEEILSFCCALCHERQMSLIHITHDMDAAQRADYVYILRQGQIAAEGKPVDLFGNAELLHREGLSLPAHLIIMEALKPFLKAVPQACDLFDADDAARFLASEFAGRVQDRFINIEGISTTNEALEPASEEVIRIEGLSYCYDADATDSQALDAVSLDLRRGEILALCGHSGSGKSTLITHLNGLIRPQKGSVRVLGLDASKEKDIPQIRKKLGLVFQYPENQLFEASVAEDIAFGPKQLGLSGTEIQERVERAAELCGLSPDDLKKAPFELSGGQKRRVAIAGILSMEPEILVLDEPLAGLDPAGRAELLAHLQKLRDRGLSLLLVTHYMDDAARVADRVALMREGRIMAIGTVREIFDQEELLNSCGLASPHTAQFIKAFNRYSGMSLSAYSEEDAIQLFKTLLCKANEVHDGGTV